MRSIRVLLLLVFVTLPFFSQTQVHCTLKLPTVPRYDNVFPFGINRCHTIVSQVMTNNATLRRGSIRYNTKSNDIYTAPNSVYNPGLIDAKWRHATLAV